LEKDNKKLSNKVLEIHPLMNLNDKLARDNNSYKRHIDQTNENLAMKMMEIQINKMRNSDWK